MLAFLRLTRPLNLVIIALTMAAMRYGVIGGNLERGLQLLLSELGGTVERSELLLPEGFGPQMPLLHFVLLVLSTMLVAAGGNVINDYFDTRIDRINKPGDVIVGRSVKRRVAMTGHLVLSGLGLVLGAFVAWRAGLLVGLLIPAFSIGALWTYSTTFKRRLVIGNGLVATLTALVPITIGLYEIRWLQRTFAEPQIVGLPNGLQFEMEPAFQELWYWILAYAAFAFLSTLVRELQKDMADRKGDEAEGCRTIPIVFGMKWAKTLVLLYIGLLVAGLLFLRASLLHDDLSFWYIGIGVIAPLLISAGFTFSANNRSEHVRAGQLMKVAMVMAVGYALLIGR
ncbi:MAG: geranylgeranylglycerol-phosphate geranylgeranyltransferase [Flavobacteriales bacterium]|nr:geranylgeranylglycerol-phosphate geranylgeranyltransferase [Flavobacteriales bacterium]